MSNQTATIYRVTCTKAYMMSEQGNAWSLSPWGKDTARYEGCDDGGQMYILPAGIVVAKSNAEMPEIYDGDFACPLIDHEGSPAIIRAGGEVQPLQKL